MKNLCYVMKKVMCLIWYGLNYSRAQSKRNQRQILMILRFKSCYLKENQRFVHSYIICMDVVWYSSI